MIITDLAISVLTTRKPSKKVAAAHHMADVWRAGQVNSPLIPIATIPRKPGRPDRPALVDPKHVKRRRLGSLEGRIALLHAIAHIEFNAIDLAADMLARFCQSPRIADDKRHDFINDWVRVCDDEARHFTMIENRLADLGSTYGALPAHDGLWQAAQSTAQDLLARLVVAPMVLEARGLDVTPAMIEKLNSVADSKSAAILGTIYEEEIPHVAIGTKWFLYICAREEVNPETTFKSLLGTYYKGTLKPPFNDDARIQAGMLSSFYQA